MKSTTVKYFCDLCGKEITKDPCFEWFTGSAFMYSGLIGAWKRIDLCYKCRDFIRKNGRIEKRIDNNEDA